MSSRRGRGLELVDDAAAGTGGIADDDDVWGWWLMRRRRRSRGGEREKMLVSAMPMHAHPLPPAPASAGDPPLLSLCLPHPHASFFPRGAAVSTP